MTRHDNRPLDALRPLECITHYTEHADGSVLFACGKTRVLCNASIIPGVPPFLRDSDQGWLTAEYRMLPQSTHTRHEREKRGPSGRTMEIQRLIGRCLRSAIDLKKLGQRTLMIDCDVLQADGGTRTTAINGAMVAIKLAIKKLLDKKQLTEDPIIHPIAAISVGIVNGTPVLDLDYQEDAQAETDMNIVMTDQQHFVEIQGNAEKKTFSAQELQQLLALAQKGTSDLFEHLLKIPLS